MFVLFFSAFLIIICICPDFQHLFALHLLVNFFLKHNSAACLFSTSLFPLLSHFSIFEATSSNTCGSWLKSDRCSAVFCDLESLKNLVIVFKSWLDIAKFFPFVCFPFPHESVPR